MPSQPAHPWPPSPSPRWCLARLCCRQMGREEAPSGASASASRPWDAAVAAGTQGQARLLLTLAATQGNATGSHGLPWSRSRPTRTCRHRESDPRFIRCHSPSWESPRFCAEKQRVSVGRDAHGRDTRQAPRFGGVLGKATPGLPAVGTARSIGAGEMLPCERLGFAGRPPRSHLQTLHPDQAELPQRHQDTASPMRRHGVPGRSIPPGWLHHALWLLSVPSTGGKW